MGSSIPIAEVANTNQDSVRESYLHLSQAEADPGKP